jgi:hypothetical protein
MYATNSCHCVFQGSMDYQDNILSYFNKNGVTITFLFKRNTLPIFVLANS